MKAGLKMKTVTPLNKWKSNVPQQIKEILANASNETKIIEYTGNWNGVEYDSAIVWIHSDDIELLSISLAIQKDKKSYKVVSTTNALK